MTAADLVNASESKCKFIHKITPTFNKNQLLNDLT